MRRLRRMVSVAVTATAALGGTVLAAYFGALGGGTVTTENAAVRDDVVVSGIGSRVDAIWDAGRERGNSAHTFAVIGDSISADGRFLRPIAAGEMILGEYGNLQDTVTYFAGPDGRGANPFSVPSVAARGGWMTETVLNPANADAGFCQQGETPLSCELRLAQPAVALIMLGTNDLWGARTLDTYRANLETIVQTCINAGTIPVLSTIPPLTQTEGGNARVPEFNAVVIDIARQYEVPLWNYWLALQDLPDYGLSADHIHPNSPPDGQSTTFDADHLQYGMTVRNLTALQMLDALRRDVLN
jgi:hypothetical protein